MVLELLLADPARLNLPEEEALGQDEAEARLRLERSLRRRLERHAFPSIFHDIEPRPPEGFPDPEAPPRSLSDTDMARRAMRRRAHESGRRDEARREQEREWAVAADKLLAKPASGGAGYHPARGAEPPAPPPVERSDEQPTAGRMVPGPSDGATGDAPARVLGDAIAAAAMRRRRRKSSSD